MKTNLDTIRDVVAYIEDHLEDKLDLDSLCRAAGYSKYHLGRMFSEVVGFSVHTYIQRRRLTEAARRLVFTDRPILEIALLAGYETQRSFAVGFKALYKCSPRAFRKKGDFCPLQLRYSVDGRQTLRGDRILDVQTVERGAILLVGYKRSTRFGFFVIGPCWRRLHAKKHTIPHRTNTEFLTGLHDYTAWDPAAARQPTFAYYAASEVSQFGAVPKGMESKRLPAARYVVFTFRAKNEDSMQPVADYIYKKWLPQSTCRLSEDAQYDFARYGEDADETGQSRIEYWVPIE